MGNRPRQFTAEFKAKVILDVLMNGKSLSQASREYGIKDSVLSRWRQEFIERAPQVFEQRTEVGQREARIAELERIVGRVMLELEMAKKASSLLSATPGGSGGS